MIAGLRAFRGRPDCRQYAPRRCRPSALRSIRFIRRGQFRLKQTPGADQPAFHGLNRHSQRLGDLGIGHFGKGAQQEWLLQGGGQFLDSRSDSSFELNLVRERIRPRRLCLQCRRLSIIEIGGAVKETPDPSPTTPVSRLVEGNLKNPGPKRALGVEVGKSPPSGEECLLNHVFNISWRDAICPRERGQPCAVRTDQFTEGGPIPGRRLPCKIAVEGGVACHRAPRLSAATRASS